MITNEEVLELLKSTESYRVERTTSTGNMDKFCEAICAFANDMPGSRKNGYLIIGAADDGRICGMKVDDALLKRIAGIRSDGNILPLPVMSVERFVFPEGELLVAEVRPSDLPPVRYRGRVFIRIGPRRDIATEAEERILSERRCSFMATFDASPCLGANIDDLDVEYIKSKYLPMAIDDETLASDNRGIKEQLTSLHLYDRGNDCPTYASIILFGKNPKYFLLGNYVQFVRYAGSSKGGDILNERQFAGPLCKMLPMLESFVKDAVIAKRPVPESLFRERNVWNYPDGAVRELIMNACMHRDYQSNMPIRLYQFDDYIEVMNAGGLYGEARPENFPLINDYRNPIVAEGMRVMKYVNKFNRGVTRVQEMLRDNGNPPAEFDVNAITAFRVNVIAAYSVLDKSGRGHKSGAQVEDTSREHKSRAQVEGTSRGHKSRAQVGGVSPENQTVQRILEFCREPHSLVEIAAHCGFQNRRKFRERYITPLLGERLQMTIPDKPTSSRQKYRTVAE